MQTLTDMFSKVAVTLVSAAVLGSFGYIIKMSGDINEIERIHVRIEQTYIAENERVNKMEQQIEDLQHDVRALMIAVGKNEREDDRAHNRPSPQPAF